MMENSSYIKPYFYIEGEKVIYPASTWKRIGARFVDIFLVNIFLYLFFAILYSNITDYYIGEEMTSNDVYADFIPQLYSLAFMLVISFAILLLIAFNLLIPLFNKKNPGQTFGKLLFGITPIFFTKSSKKIITTRELPLTIIVIMPLIISLILGGNPIFYYSQAQDFIDNGGTIEKTKDETLAFYIFIREYMTNPNIMPGGVTLNQVTAAFIYLKQIFTGIYWIFLIVLLISIAFNPQKMGFIDKLANTSVVDLKKIIDRSLIEGDSYYLPNTTLNPKDAFSNEGPPVELNK